MKQIINLKVTKPVHKLRTQKGGFAFTMCDIPLHIKGGKAIDNWSFVDCKKCLKSQR